MLTICLAPGSSFRPRNQICARDNQANLANENTEKFKSLDEVINIQGIAKFSSAFWLWRWKMVIRFVYFRKRQSF